MLIQDEENQALRAWRDQENNNSQHHRNRSSGAGCFGTSFWSEPIRICRESGEGQDTTGDPRAGSPGGVVDDLVAELVDQITDAENLTERLKQRLSHLQSLQKQLKGHEPK